MRQVYIKMLSDKICFLVFFRFPFKTLLCLIAAYSSPTHFAITLTAVKSPNDRISNGEV